MCRIALIASAAIAAIFSTPAAAAYADPASPCTNGQVIVTAGHAESGRPPTVTVTPTQPAQAVVEGDTANPDNVDVKYPTYSDLLVTAPDTTKTITVPAGIDGACHFQVHPLGSQM